MNIRSYKYGFSIVEVMVITGVIVLLAGLGFVGWRTITTQNKANTASTTTSLKSAKVITTKADLEAAQKSLDDLNFNDENDAKAESQASL